MLALALIENTVNLAATDHPDVRHYKRNQYVQICVRHARTHIDDGKAQFTDYEVELKTNHIAFTIKYSKVRRRYSDFVWLRNRLIKDSPSTSSEPPTIPGRRLFGRFNKDFIKQRQTKLREFLFGLIDNMDYLSHAALHLFLQSKLTVQNIEYFLDNNKDEDASETIMAESEGKARLDGVLLKERNKHDSGFSDEAVWFSSSQSPSSDNAFESNNNNNNSTSENNEEHFADVESDEDGVEEEASKQPSDEEELVNQTKSLRVSQLPAPVDQSLEDQFESSVEYLYSDSYDSDTSKRSSMVGSNRSSMVGGSNRSSMVGSTSDYPPSSVPNTPKKRGRRHSRQHRRSMLSSNNSLQDLKSSTVSESQLPLRRSKSFYDDPCPSASNTDNRRCRSFRNSYRNSRDSSSLRSPDLRSPRHGKLSRNRSFMSSTERTPVKRKISLNEYIIVKRDSVMETVEPIVPT